MREHSKYKTLCMYTVLAFFNKFQIHDLGNLVILKFFFFQSGEPLRFRSQAASRRGNQLYLVYW